MSFTNRAAGAPADAYIDADTSHAITVRAVSAMNDRAWRAVITLLLRRRTLARGVATVATRSCRQSTAATIRPSARIRSASSHARARAPARPRRRVSGPTSAVTKRDPRSLSGSSSEAGIRSDRGVSGQVDGVRDQRGRRVGARRVGGEHGHRVGDPEREAPPVTAARRDARGSARPHARWPSPSTAGRSGIGTSPTSNVSPRRQVQRDVPAVVHVGATQSHRRPPSPRRSRRRRRPPPRPSA